MKHHSIATVVNFCSNEIRFIRATLEQAMLFSSQVIVPVCDHFFDGTKENQTLLDQVYTAFPECLFVEYPYVPEKIPKKIWKKVGAAHFWHSFSRLIGTQFVHEDIEKVLFLDADEVPDGKRFSKWLENSDHMHHSTLKFANYWYFRDPANQALKYEDSIVLVQKRALGPQMLLCQEERDAIYNLAPGPKRRNVMGCDGNPMFHHYSWVRTQEEMLKKVKAWGHKQDRDWTSLVKEEFAAPFKGTDFVHGYSYKLVKPFFDLRFEMPIFKSKGVAQIKKLGEDEILRLVKMKKNWNFLDF
jgi:hypothetical protein